MPLFNSQNPFKLFIQLQRTYLYEIGLKAESYEPMKMFFAQYKFHWEKPNLNRISSINANQYFAEQKFIVYINFYSWNQFKSKLLMQSNTECRSSFANIRCLNFLFQTPSIRHQHRHRHWWNFFCIHNNFIYNSIDIVDGGIQHSAFTNEIIFIVKYIQNIFIFIFHFSHGLNSESLEYLHCISLTLVQLSSFFLFLWKTSTFCDPIHSLIQLDLNTFNELYCQYQLININFFQYILILTDLPLSMRVHHSRRSKKLIFFFNNIKPYSPNTYRK